LLRKECHRAPRAIIFAGADHVNRDPAFPTLKSTANFVGCGGNVIERPGDYASLNVAECIELVLSDDDLGADVDATIQIDHVVVDKAEATG
jgi:hypothetical protein